LNSNRPTEGSRRWTTPDAIHIDVRGLEPPEPMRVILRLIDAEEIETALIAHLDREPIFLYPELNERGWSYEILPATGATPPDDDEVLLRMVRL
jgi:hypothetical protein